MCNIKCGQLLFEDFPVACCDILGKDYDRYVSIGKGLRYFDAVISPMVFFGEGHRTMYKTDLRNFDVLFRKLFRSVVGPPAGMDRTRPWH